MSDSDDSDAFQLRYEGVAPFPTERFLKFASKLKVQSKDYGLTQFRLLGSQRYILDCIIDGLSRGITTFVILKARQLGSSTFFLCLDMFWAFEHKGLLGVFITHKEEARDDFRSTVEVFFAETPPRFRIAYARHNRNMLILKNGSKFRYLIAGTSEAKKGGLGRGGAANFVHATECAFYGNQDDLSEFRSQTSSLYPHRLQVYETTANGFNGFFDMWEISKTDPTKMCIFVGWWRDERNQLPVSHPFFNNYMPDGIKTALTLLERKRCRLVREQYGFEISLQQIAWWRWHLAAEKDGDTSLMDQEFPCTEDDAFQATGSKFFTVEAMTDCLRAAKKIPFHTFRYKLTHKFEDTEVRQVKDVRAELRIWEDASRFGYYALGCDPAYGSSDEADRTVISIWRCYSDCMVQAAEYCSTQPSTYQCAWVLAHLAGYYGLTYLMPILEMNGPGKAVFDELQKVQKMASEIKPNDERYHIRNILKNMRHYFYRRMDSPGGGELLYQWKTTHDLKHMALNMMKNGVELGRMIPRSVPLLEEMRRVVNNDGNVEAEGRSKDDRVMAGALAYQAWNTWVQPRCKAAGLTMAKSMEIETKGGVPPTERIIQEYLRRMGITVPQ
jgi:terminase large subunit-like protein